MIKTLKRYYALIDKHRISLLVAIVLGIISGVLSIWPIKFTGYITDAIKLNTLEYEYLIKNIAILFIMLVITYFFDAYYNYVVFRNYYYVDCSIRVNILKKIIKQRPPFFIKHSASNIITKATSDSDAAATAVSYGVLTAVDGIVLPIIYFTAMALINFWLFLIAFIALPIMVYFVVLISNRIDKLYNASLESQDIMNAHALESFTNIKVIKAFCTNKTRLKEFLIKVDDNHSKELAVNNLEHLYVPVVSGIMSLFAIISIIVGAFLINKGQITLGDLVTHSMLLAQFSWPAFAVADLIVVSKSGALSLKRIDEILEYPEEPKAENPIKLNHIDTIEFKNYSFKYPNSDSYTLKNIDLKISAGQKIGIVGKIGSGKTTLLKQIINEYYDFEGEFLINDISIRDLDLNSYRSQIGYVPQEHFLFSKSVKDNILFYRNGDYKKASEYAHLEKDIDSFVDGVNTMCGEMGITLSGGQKQRVSLARGLLLSPQILILDDVLSAVDNNTEKEIIDHLNQHFSNSTVIISSHRLSVIENSDEIIVLDEGKIVERGTFEELIDNRGWFYEQYKLQEVDYE